MERNGETDLFGKLHDSEVLYDERVRLDAFEEHEIIAHRVDLTTADEVVDRYVQFDTVLVSIFDRFFKLFVVKVRIGTMHTHVEAFTAEIDGICACLDDCFEDFPAACGS